MRLFDVSTNFLLTTMKWNAIISKKYDISEFPDKFPNDLRLGIIGNYKIYRKYQNFIEL